jgi:hypothetical protein
MGVYLARGSDKATQAVDGLLSNMGARVEKAGDRRGFSS